MKQIKAFIDVETFSSVDLKTSGMYKYVASEDFEILLISYSINGNPVITIDLASGEQITDEFEELLFDDTVLLVAHNAAFERNAFRRIGYDIPTNRWYCTMIKAAYCGLPLSLDEVSTVLNLENKKAAIGKALIKYFSCPCKPTRLNGMRKRNYPHHNPEKWADYKSYNVGDVKTEVEIYYTLEGIEIPEFEKKLYILDQTINDFGIKVDKAFILNALKIDSIYSEALSSKVTEKYGIDNPNSSAQLKQWLKDITGNSVESLNKTEMPNLLNTHKDDEDISFVLQARQQLSKSSIKKYTAMLSCMNKDSRVRGLFQFYGANRTGRWAGRLVQLHNLPRNSISNLSGVRHLVATNNYSALEILYGDLGHILSQLIRTAFIPETGKIFAVADFSAIEARVISWLANEEWRIEVFKTHGKIYEATAAKMFNVPLELITKDSDLRQKGKVAELALGYQGSLGALKRMGGESMGLSDGEMMDIVRKWRTANPNIVAFWEDIDKCARQAVIHKIKVLSAFRGLEFNYEELGERKFLSILLPSGRKLYYYNPKIKTGIKNLSFVSYEGVVQETKTWGEIDTYGGKIAENITQAIARDLLAVSMLKINNAGYPIVIHVHDEVGCEVDDEKDIKILCDIMGEDVEWAVGLPLKAAGFVTNFYKKD